MMCNWLSFRSSFPHAAPDKLKEDRNSQAMSLPTCRKNVLMCGIARLRRPNKCKMQPTLGAKETYYTRTFESLPAAPWILVNVPAARASKGRVTAVKRLQQRLGIPLPHPFDLGAVLCPLPELRETWRDSRNFCPILPFRPPMDVNWHTKFAPCPLATH